MKDRLPPLQGMYYFYIAAEKGSFKDAAEQLFVTAAAISQQIRQLEEWLDCELFERQHRKVKLTAEGELLFQSAKRGFFELQDGVRKLNQDPEPGRLAISTHPTFAQHWLIPRLKSFRENNPDLSLLVDPKNELVNFQNGLIDICVRYGRGNYSGLETIKLMDEVLYPVCHPSYQEDHGLYETEDLIRADLIEDVWPDMTWSLWFEKLRHTKPCASIKYDGSQFVMEGALAAQGVALVKHSLAYRYLQEGKLVRIGSKAAKSEYSYFICAPSGYFRRDKIQIFVQWLKAEVLKFQQRGEQGIDLLNLRTESNGVIKLNE
ncbi:LysR substrate-binding domain-containing protein [Vibrio sp. HN007]|uniref:LysR substrate-binding domain-containing protein n=1 Tax=Vibrio iocasae TaxID=3098914 RepID=UPI0035D4154D